LWENQAALEQHAASPHYKRLELSIRDLLEEPFEINILREVLSPES
jgi:quinol monooxygenase YgiN